MGIENIEKPKTVNCRKCESYVSLKYVGTYYNKVFAEYHYLAKCPICNFANGLILVEKVKGEEK